MLTNKLMIPKGCVGELEHHDKHQHFTRVTSQSTHFVKSIDIKVFIAEQMGHRAVCFLQFCNISMTACGFLFGGPHPSHLFINRNYRLWLATVRPFTTVSWKESENQNTQQTCSSRDHIQQRQVTWTITRIMREVFNVDEELHLARNILIIWKIIIMEFTVVHVCVLSLQVWDCQMNCVVVQLITYSDAILVLRFIDKRLGSLRKIHHLSGLQQPAVQRKGKWVFFFFCRFTGNVNGWISYSVDINNTPLCWGEMT